jgi:dihydropteroate synthase
MGRVRSPTTNPDPQSLPEAVSGASVKVFACLGGNDLAGELAALQGGDAAVTVRRLLPATAKLQLPSAWEVSIARLVASCPGVTLYRSSLRGEDLCLLLTASVHDLQECAKALCLLEAPAAALGRDMLDQVSQIYPCKYGALEVGGQRVDFSVKTGIMGILNVTPDSFYDGGRFVEPQLALERAHQMVQEGADLIDIGGQSSRPGSEPVPETEEARRVLPIIEAVAGSVRAIISVDTYRAAIARAALDAGAHLINDISALRFDPSLMGVVAERQVPLILMHMKGLPRNMHLHPSYEALIDEVFAFLRERLRTAEAGGVSPALLLIDPGVGFGKGAHHDLELLRKLHHFHALGRPIIISPSRKSFIGRILGTGVDERLEGTAATVATAIMQGASIIRVHDVRAMAHVARMMDVLVRPHFTLPPEGQGLACTGQARPNRQEKE